MSLDYARLSTEAIAGQLAAIAQDVAAAFGPLDALRLNWRPAPSRWSVAQCLQHLVTANELMMHAASAAGGGDARSIWQRMPILPRLWGPMLIRSQAPVSTRRFVAPPRAQPSASAIPVDIVERFVHQHREAARVVARLDEAMAARTIMVSPFVRFITYSVLDGWRLIVAHDQRHVEQAWRVVNHAQFPRAASAAP